MDPQTALYVAVAAAVVGPTFAVVLTAIGGFINDYFASRRERRQQEREDRRARDQREREERGIVRRARQESYTAFVRATIVREPLTEAGKSSAHATLASSYTNVLLYASKDVRLSATRLYDRAATAIDTEDEHTDVWTTLDRERGCFLSEVRHEAEEFDTRRSGGAY